MQKPNKRRPHPPHSPPITPPTKSVARRVLTLIIKATVLMGLLLILTQVLTVISRPEGTISFEQMIKMPGVITGSWQRMRLLQEPLPADDSLPNPLPGRHLADTWGGARSQGRTHEGIDIFAPRGTPILSTTHGVVAKVGENTLGGRTVTVIGPGGAAHYYAHMDSYADITRNDWVQAGDTLGFVGDSGNAKGTPTHVHYGIYINGRAVNPYPLLQKP